MPLSTVLDLSDLSNILRSYDFEPASHAHLSEGVENTNYRIDVSGGKGDRVVTVLENRNMVSAEEYARFLVSLYARGVPLPRLSSRTDGGLVSLYRGKPVVVSDYIHGRCYDSLPLAYLHATGQVLAAIHRTGGVDPLPDPVVRLGPAEFENICSFVDKEFSTWLLDWHAKVRYVTEDGAGNQGLTHGDLFADNIVTTLNGGVVVLDWENGARDYYELDLGMAVLGLTGENNVFSPERARLFLRGYFSVRDIDLSSARLLDATIYAALFTAYHRFLKHEIDDTNSGKQGYYREIPKFVQSLIAHWDLVAV